MYSCRFEMRGSSKLLSVKSNAYLGFSFYSCNMGGSSITNSEVYQIEALSSTNRNQLRIHFFDCANFANYKMQSVADESSYSYFTEVTFDRCIIDIDKFISAMSCTNINNSEGYPKVYVDGVLYTNTSKAKLRNGESPIHYIKKSSADSNFNSSIAAGLTTTYNSFFKKYIYAGAVTFNIVPTQDIRLCILNSAATTIYYDVTIKAYTKFNQTILIDKFITEDDYVVIKITNKSSSTTCVIQGHAEVHSTLFASHILMLKSALSSLNAVQKGMITYDSVSKSPAIWDGSYWKNTDGFNVGKKFGTSAERPTLTNDDIGFCFFDKTLMKPIWYHGNSIWKDINNEQV